MCIFKQRTSSTRHYSNSGSYTNIHQSLFLSFSAFCPIINKAENLELILFQFQKDTRGCALKQNIAFRFLVANDIGIGLEHLETMRSLSSKITTCEASSSCED